MNPAVVSITDGPGLGNNVVDIGTGLCGPGTVVVGEETLICQGVPNNTVVMGGSGGDAGGPDFETGFLDIYTGAGGGGTVYAINTTVVFGSFLGNTTSLAAAAPATRSSTPATTSTRATRPSPRVPATNNSSPSAEGSRCGEQAGPNPACSLFSRLFLNTCRKPPRGCGLCRYTHGTPSSRFNRDFSPNTTELGTVNRGHWRGSRPSPGLRPTSPRRGEVKQTVSSRTAGPREPLIALAPTGRGMG